MIIGSSIPNIDLKLSSSELFLGKKLLKDIIQNNKKTICLFTYATGEKCYSKSWWSDLYALLLKGLPEYNFIEILPVENISNLSRKAPVFYSKNIRELSSFIANTSLVIAADSGIMHLVSSSLTPTVGLFSVTDPKMYSPYNEFSIAIETKLTSIENIYKIVEKILNKIEQKEIR